MIKILIVDDHDVVRAGLKQILELEEDFEVIGMASSGFECLEFLQDGSRPDLIFMDLKMPDLNGIQTLKIISQKYPNAKVIMLTVYDDRQYIAQAIQAGARGYVLKGAQRADLITLARKVAKGHTFLDPALSERVFDTIKQGSDPDDLEANALLTKRELEVLNCLVKGFSDKQVAGELHISEHTARTHTKNIYRKLGVSSRSQAAVKAMKENLI